MGGRANRRIAFETPEQRRRKRRRARRVLLAMLVCAAAGAALLDAPVLLGLAGRVEAAAAAGEVPVEVEAAIAPPDAAPRLHPAHALLQGATPGPDGRLRALRADGAEALLTLDPVLQQKMQWLLEDYDVPWGAVVALEPATGRILALAQHSAHGPHEARGIAFRPLAPAASIFKVITAAALLEAGVPASRTVCFHGGKRRLQPALLRDSPLDQSCVTLADAMGLSANVPFAKLAQRHLAPARLREVAERFLFARPIELEGVPVQASPLEIPDEDFAFATTAAGFHDGVRLTPLHAALLAAAIANGGTMPVARLVDAIDGVEVEGAPGRRVLDEATARALAGMMVRTVEDGTARNAFRERGRDVMEGIRVAGKTGSLFEQRPFRDATWFVGFAPLERPAIAVAVVIVNESTWRIRAPYVAREAIRSHLLGTSPWRPR